MSVLGRAWLFAGLVTAGLAFASQAQATVYNGLTMAQLKSIFAAGGKTATEIQTGYLRLQDGPVVQLTQCPANDPVPGNCYEIQIFRTFSNVKPTLQAVNQWNFNTKIPEASVDSSGNLHMEFWVTTVGMTDQLLLDSIGWFEGAWQDPDGQQFWQPYMTSGAGS
ncbi:MAG TPA: hypothetical protein VEH07_05305 [Alphaproteobacteria bacterium]|nr:hypothetical protein [Alphaproteobacteria bacterium]